MTKYHMQKSEREIIDPDKIQQVIRDGKFLTLAFCADNNPYILTLNYGYDEKTQSLYFHTAQRGLKLDYIMKNPTVCGTIVEDHGYIHEVCSHAYRSVVFYGVIEILVSQAEKQAGLEIMLDHLESNPEILKKRLLYRAETYTNLVIMRLRISEITGKEGNVA